MKPILPREMLWTDKKTMEEFFELDPVNKEFYEVFITLRGEPFSVTEDAVKVFNEVYYQLTRMMFEDPMSSNREKYETDIQANLRWDCSPALVMTMIYFIRALNAKCIKSLSSYFFNDILEEYGYSLYWKMFGQRYLKLHSNSVWMKYKFRPAPRPVSYFTNMYVEWLSITRSYDLMSIGYVLNLWKSPQDKKTIAKMILERMCAGGVNHPNGIECGQVKDFMDRFFDIDLSSTDEAIEDTTGDAAPIEKVKPVAQQQSEPSSPIDLRDLNGKPAVFNINNAEINVNSGGNIIGKEINYGTNG